MFPSPCLLYTSVATLGSAVLWLVVVVLGIIPGIYKSYQYRFVPYILITRSDVNATAALRLSKEMTKGKKGQMFLADIVLGAGMAVVMLCLLYTSFSAKKTLSG